jgi:hypothetical protein
VGRVRGRNFVLAMSDARARCGRVLALSSPACFERSWYTAEEGTTALVHAPGTGQGRLVPVRVEPVAAGDMPVVLRPLTFVNLSMWSLLWLGPGSNRAFSSSFCGGCCD